jgi:hypothetical protein
MVRSKQAIQVPSSADSHEALTVWIISAIVRGVYRRKGQKYWLMRNLDRLLQKRNGRVVSPPMTRRLARVWARKRFFARL